MRWFRAVLFLLSLAAMGLHAGEKMPAPPEVLTAKKAYLVDQVGDTKVADHVYGKLKKWGRWEIVSEESQAEIVLVLTNNVQNYGTIATGQTWSNFGSAMAIALSSDKRFLAVYGRASNKPLITVSSEAYIASGSTAGRLVNTLRDRIDRSESRRK